MWKMPNRKIESQKDVSNVETAAQMQSMVAVLHSGAGHKVCKLFLESHVNVLVQ